jgi:hypothetical protein
MLTCYGYSVEVRISCVCKDVLCVCGKRKDKRSVVVLLKQLRSDTNVLYTVLFVTGHSVTTDRLTCAETFIVQTLVYRQI